MGHFLFLPLLQSLTDIDFQLSSNFVTNKSVLSPGIQNLLTKHSTKVARTPQLFFWQLAVSSPANLPGTLIKSTVEAPSMFVVFFALPCNFRELNCKIACPTLRAV